VTIDLEEAQAFAISDDHQAQERVLTDVSEWNRSPALIRRHLTEGEISATDKRVRFVGLDAYEQAGGIVRRDLFDDEASGTLLDTPLLDRLVGDKLSVVADMVRTEGWVWVDIVADFDRSVLADFGRVHPDRIDPTDEQQALSDALSEEYDTLADSAEADEGDEAVLARLTEIEETLSGLEQSQILWPAETLAVAGAIVAVAYNGTPAIERGLIRRGDAPVDTAADETAPREPAGISAVLIADLTAQKTAALRVALARNVPVALAATVHAMTLEAFYAFGAERSCLQITLQETMPERLVAHADSVKALQDNIDAHALWADRLPSEPADLWPWCLAQTQDMLLSLMAFVMAQSVNAVRQKADRRDCGRLVSADALAAALNLDTVSWFTPGADNYFGRISSAQIIAALCEAKGVSPAPSWAKMKKAELAAFAAREIAGTGWLPETLRIPGCR
jgi:ParB family chromosome partitioning protein